MIGGRLTVIVVVLLILPASRTEQSPSQSSPAHATSWTLQMKQLFHITIASN